MSSGGSLMQHQRTDAHSVSARAFLIDLVLAVLLSILACLAGSWIKHACQEYVPIIEDAKQSHYFSIGDQSQGTAGDLALWLEPGKNGTTYLRRTPGYTAALEHFLPANDWSRAVYWHVNAATEGTLLLSFPPGKASSVAVFMTDGNSRWRMSELTSGKQHLIADQLHNGRWFYIAISPAEAQAGSKRIEFRRLTGDDIALSAITIIK